MGKDLSTLVEDINGLFGSGYEPSESSINELGTKIATTFKRVFEKESPGYLRMSNLGTKCDRKLWYSVNQPEAAEPLPPEARLKFAYGHILEELVLFLAKEAGHTVEGTQDTLEINGVKGHRDAIVDGVVVDVKSASSYSFKKFDEGLTSEADAFGYLDQLNAYLYASKDDPQVTHKDVAAFIAVDKTLGHITVDVQPSNGKDYDKLVEEKTALVESKKLPPRGYEDEEEGKSGNRKLGTACSYCPFKKHCWPGLQTYIYSTGPRYLTSVWKQPNVPKAD